MNALSSRLRRLEVNLIEPDYLREPNERIVACPVDRKANLINTKCQRTLCPGGLLMEVVTLDGDRESISDEDLDRVVEKFPVAIMAV